MLVAGCSSTATYNLPGHTAELHNAPISLKVGDKRLALVTHNQAPAPAASEMSLVSENPEVVTVERTVAMGDRAQYHLIAKSAGQALVHYVDRFQYSPMQATTEGEQTDLHAASLGSFYVTVTP